MVSFNKRLLLTFQISLNPSTNQDMVSILCRAPREADGNELPWHSWQRCLPTGAAQRYLQVSSNLTVSALISPGVFSDFCQDFPLPLMCVLFCSSQGM